MKRHIKVVGAVIVSDRDEILCALRSPAMKMAGFWEFPGGKVEADETPAEAIVREIREELGCDIEALDIHHDHTHEYEAFTVNLITLHCRILSGTPVPAEHAELRWVKRQDLALLDWLPADLPAISLLMAERAASHAV